MWPIYHRAYQWDPTQYQTYKLATNIFLFWFLMWHYLYLTLYSANGKITDGCSIGKDPERQDMQKWHSILVFCCRGWETTQTKGMWRHAWDLKRHLLNTWLKCYSYTRLVCVENIVLHKIHLKWVELPVVCKQKSDHDVQSNNTTNWKKWLPTNCTSQNTQDCYSDVCQLLRVAIFSEYISQTYSQHWQMTYHLLCEMYSLKMVTLNS
jgi:hypothetical protein